MNNEERILSLLENIDMMRKDMAEIKSTVVRIEKNHGEMLKALCDIQKQNADRLDRIQTEVTRHEEVILRRVK